MGLSLTSEAENSLGTMETAYLILKDCREGSPQTVTPGDTKSILGKVANETDAVKQKSAEPETKTLKVQFNPTSLTFQSSPVKKKEEKASIDKKENGDVETTKGEDNENQLAVSMTLVFDRSVYVDCSVQSQVDGFLGLIKNPYIRQTTFCWGKLYYEGVIQRVNAEYVMFNALGIPTRANVALTLQLL